MDKTTDKNGKVTAEILNIWENAIQPENLEIAVRFFDFSQEMDLSLLDKVTFQNIDKLQSTSKFLYLSQSFWDKIARTVNEYTDRYILFLDALGANTIFSMFGYNFIYSIKSRSLFKEQLTHALSLRYNETDAKAKILALAAESLDDVVFDRDSLKELAENDMKLLLYATDFCKGELVNAQVKLVAAALYYTEPQTMDLNSEVNFLLNVCQENKDTLLCMEACFMGYRHDVRLKEACLNKFDNVLCMFAHNILHSVSGDYLVQNRDALMEILFHNNPKQDLKKFIPECIAYILKKEDVTPYDSEHIEHLKRKIYPLFSEIAKAYPDEYILAMYADMCDADYNLALKNSYPLLYDILSAVNPQAITAHGLNRQKDSIERLISEEQKHWQPSFSDKLGEYFRGNIPLSDLAYAFEDMHNNSYSVFYELRTLVQECFTENNDFQKRYTAAQCILGGNTIILLLGKYVETQLANGIRTLIAEHVPIHYRFMAYEKIYNRVSCINKVWGIILDTMVKMKSHKDKEYADYLFNGTVFERMLYTEYLDRTNDNNCNKAAILKLCTDSSVGVRTLACTAAAKHKDYEPEVLELLKSKKAAVREVGIDILTRWGISQKYAEILEQHAATEKSSKLVDKINTILGTMLSESSVTDNSITTLVEQMTKGGKNRKLSWFYTDTFNDKVHLLNGTEAGTKYMQALLLCYAGVDTPERSEQADRLAQELNQDELQRFVGEVFLAWIDSGAEAKKKWVLYFCAIHGGSDMLDGLLHYIKEWAENSRGAIAADAVKAMALNGSSQALMSIDNLAHKCKFKQVKNAAVQALDSAAESLGITSDELGDRIIPHLGFGQNMERIFDYGTRQFKVYLTPTLELEVYDENDKKLKSLPAPAKKDTDEVAKKSNNEFKQMKKQLKSIVALQKTRLETALLADRRWSVNAWTNLFVKNPIMHSFAIGLIWAAYENDTLVQTFRYMEDGTFNTVDEDEYTLPENCTVGLVHPIDLDKDMLHTWKEQLSDYEIIQPIAQLERPV